MSAEYNDQETEAIEQTERIMVLLVDDQMMVAEGIRRMLEGERDIGEE